MEGRTQNELLKNWVLKKIFGPKREGVIGSRRKQHNKELRDL
jgi:hypothetical protein